MQLQQQATVLRWIRFHQRDPLPTHASGSAKEKKTNLSFQFVVQKKKKKKKKKKKEALYTRVNSKERMDMSSLKKGDLYDAPKTFILIKIGLSQRVKTVSTDSVFLFNAYQPS